jgi:hypothetical protein
MVHLKKCAFNAAKKGDVEQALAWYATFRTNYPFEIFQYYRLLSSLIISRCFEQNTCLPRENVESQPTHLVQLDKLKDKDERPISFLHSHWLLEPHVLTVILNIWKEPASRHRVSGTIRTRLFEAISELEREEEYTIDTCNGLLALKCTAHLLDPSKVGLSEVLQYLNGMHAVCVAPNATSFSLLFCCLRETVSETPEDLIAIALNLLLDPLHKAYVPNMELYVSGYAWCRDLAHHASPLPSLHTLILGLSRLQGYHRLEHTALTFSLIVQAFAKMGAVGPCVLWFNSMDVMGFKRTPELFAYVIECCTLTEKSSHYALDILWPQLQEQCQYDNSIPSIRQHLLVCAQNVRDIHMQEYFKEKC